MLELLEECADVLDANTRTRFPTAFKVNIPISDDDRGVEQLELEIYKYIYRNLGDKLKDKYRWVSTKN